MSADTYDYVGAQDLSSNVTRYNSLVFIIQQEIAKRSIGTPVRVVSESPYTVAADGTKTPITAGTAGPIGYIDVLPLVNQVDGNGVPTPHETVYQIAYHRYQGGLGAFISDPVAGDIGHMIVPDRDTSVVLATSKQGNPGSGRRNDYADGVYVGTIRSENPVQWFTWTATGFNLMDKNGNTIVGGPTGITINGVRFPLAGSPDVILPDGVTLDTHVHDDPQGGVVGPPHG